MRGGGIRTRVAGVWWQSLMTTLGMLGGWGGVARNVGLVGEILKSLLHVLDVCIPHYT